MSRSFPGDFQSTLDWDTGINLPILFRGSWKLQPSLGISNTTSGPFALRNRNTGGAWVQQGKRFRVGVSSTPTLFAFFPGIGPLQRIRHSISPVISYNFEPAADVPEEYARAIAGRARRSSCGATPGSSAPGGIVADLRGEAAGRAAATPRRPTRPSCES